MSDSSDENGRDDVTFEVAASELTSDGESRDSENNPTYYSEDYYTNLP